MDEDVFSTPMEAPCSAEVEGNQGPPEAVNRPTVNCDSALDLSDTEVPSKSDSGRLLRVFICGYGYEPVFAYLMSRCAYGVYASFLYSSFRIKGETSS